LGLCDAEVDRERLTVRDFDTDGVIVGVAVTDEVAAGQPKPLVHVGLEVKEVPNDFVVVWVNVRERVTDGETEIVLLIDLLCVCDPELLTEGDSAELGVCVNEVDSDSDCEADIDADLDDDAVVDFDLDGVMVGVAAIEEDAEGQPKPLVHVGLADADVPKLFDVEGVTVIALETDGEPDVLPEYDLETDGLDPKVGVVELVGAFDFDTDTLCDALFVTDLDTDCDADLVRVRDDVIDGVNPYVGDMELVGGLDLDIDTDWVTDEVAAGHPKPLVHVGLAVNEVPNDFVIVCVNVRDADNDGETETVLLIDFVCDGVTDLLTEGDSSEMGVCDWDADWERLLVSDLELDDVMVGVAAVDEDAEGQPKPLVHVGLADAEVPKLVEIEGEAVREICDRVMVCVALLLLDMLADTLTDFVRLAETEGDKPYDTDGEILDTREVVFVVVVVTETDGDLDPLVEIRATVEEREREIDPVRLTERETETLGDNEGVGDCAAVMASSPANIRRKNTILFKCSF
jgi:hypothetical protein